MTYDYNYKDVVVTLILPYIAPCGAYKEVLLQSQGTCANWSMHENTLHGQTFNPIHSAHIWYTAKAMGWLAMIIHCHE